MYTVSQPSVFTTSYYSVKCFFFFFFFSQAEQKLKQIEAEEQRIIKQKQEKEKRDKELKRRVCALINALFSLSGLASFPYIKWERSSDYSGYLRAVSEAT